MRRMVTIVATTVAASVGIMSLTAAHVPRATAQVADEPVYPVLAGVTTITAEGNAGVTLRVPSDAALPDQGIMGRVDLTVEGADIAYIAMGRPECDLVTGEPRLFCVEFDFWAFPGVKQTNLSFLAWSNEGEIDPGLLNVYVLSEGTVTFTARFDGLDGATTVTATGDIDGIAEKLPTRCPELLPDCSNIGYGGAAHEFRSTGHFRLLSYSEIPDQLMGQQGNTSCFYPSYADPDVSPEVEDHPYGCDLTPTEGGSNNWLNTTSTYAVNRVGHEWTAFIQGQAYEQGRVYAGFNGDQISAVPGGHFGAIGVWLHKGITCPSNDFNDCHASDGN